MSITTIAQEAASSVESARRTAGSAISRRAYIRETPASHEEIRGLRRGAGDGLLSRELSPGVPSALSGLTTVFGMGTGVALTL